MASSTKSLITDTNDSGDSNMKDKPSKLRDSKYSWFVCACGFLSRVFILGILHAFGAFFVEFIRDFKSTKATTAWIASIAYGLSMTFGPVVSMLLNRYGNRAVMATGGMICAVAVFTSSFTTSIEQLFGTFSVLFGIGACMSMNPTMTLAHTYFDKHMTVAVGIMTAGSSVGTLVMAPLSQALIDTIGWRKTFRFFTGTCILTSILTCFIKPLETPVTIKTPDRVPLSFLRRLARDFRIWKNRVFVVWTIAISLVMFGFYIPYVHLVSFGMDLGISTEQGSLIVMLLGACTAIGRISFGKFVQLGILNRLHMHQVAMVTTGTAVMFLPLIKSFEGIIVFVIVVGLVDGCFVVLLPVLTTAFVGSEDTILAWGFLTGVSSITFTLGPPVAGALYDTFGTYDVAFHCAGIPVIAGAVVLFLIPWAQRTTDLSELGIDIVISDDVLRNEYDLRDDILLGPRESRSRIYSGSSSMHTVQSDRLRSSMLGTSDISLRMTSPSPARLTPRYRFHKEHSATNAFNTKIMVPLDIQDALVQLNSTREMLEKLLNDTSRLEKHNEKASGKSRSEVVQNQESGNRAATNGVSIMSVPSGMPSHRARRQDSTYTINTDPQGSFGRGNQLSFGSSLQSRNLSDCLYQIESPGNSMAASNFSSISNCHSLHQQTSPTKWKSVSSTSAEKETDTVTEKTDAAGFDEAVNEQIEALRDSLLSPMTTEAECDESSSQHISTLLNTLCFGGTVSSPSEVTETVSNRDSTSGVTSPRVSLSPQLTSIPEVPVNHEISTDKLNNGHVVDGQLEQPNAQAQWQSDVIEHWLDNSPNDPYVPPMAKSSQESDVSLNNVDFTCSAEKEGASVHEKIDEDDMEARRSSSPRELDVFTHLFDDNENMD